MTDSCFYEPRTKRGFASRQAETSLNWCSRSGFQPQFSRCFRQTFRRPLAFDGPIDEITEAGYNRMIAVNVTGVFVATQEAVRNTKAGGRVIHVGSSMSLRRPPRFAVDRGAVAGFTCSWCAIPV
ncbi:SDR family NAD(P)-dependent oxidoreductase [Sinorhizobium terangae]|uniref:SDR family NAD(P)-dependent oxidoreductase n=1 Tax=Sinorhizobium terangae TaxID=110322 RepID=UPI00181297B4|nr:SDR family NAD(P)-dependent oxidoreductase [Sinorhizobium terangae]MBB4185525.1 NAD(P)-dependent dehydrogenase (short-subunit alcohol dehydrogenase family) [Sinorhizobium terangae]WFU46404.1 SDR family NAD(P)-dependent oxidoreductase [Sinorhizobium terangae]